MRVVFEGYCSDPANHSADWLGLNSYGARGTALDPKESTKPCLAPLRITFAESDLK